jgi:hypothetical protein
MKETALREELTASAESINLSIVMCCSGVLLDVCRVRQATINVVDHSRAVTCTDSKVCNASASSSTPTSRCMINDNGKNAALIVNGAWKIRL